MKRMIPISFVSLILASAAIGGWILFESRDGGKEAVGTPEKDLLMRAITKMTAIRTVTKTLQDLIRSPMMDRMSW